MRGFLKKADKLIEDNLVSDIKGKENKQVAIASQSEVFPRIILREDRKRRGENVVELKCGPGKGCLNFVTLGMCSHTQAAALAWNVRQEYWRFLESSKKVGTSLHSLSRHGLPSGSGKKENQMQRGANKKPKSTIQKQASNSVSVTPNQQQISQPQQVNRLQQVSHSEQVKNAQRTNQPLPVNQHQQVNQLQQVNQPRPVNQPLRVNQLQQVNQLRQANQPRQVNQPMRVNQLQQVNQLRQANQPRQVNQPLRFNQPGQIYQQQQIYQPQQMHHDGPQQHQLPIRGQCRGTVHAVGGNLQSSGVVSTSYNHGVIPSLPTMILKYPTPQPGQFWLYLLQFCAKTVKTCFGCAQTLKINGNICEPPHDLVIVSHMKRGFTLNGQQMTKLQNVYFHFNQDCVKKNNLHFILITCSFLLTLYHTFNQSTFSFLPIMV